MPDFTLRSARPEDAAAMAAIYAPYVLHGTASFEAAAPDAAEMAGRLAKLAETFPWLVYETPDGAILGYAYGSRVGERAGYDWSAACSIYVAESRVHGGVGRVLYTALLALLAAQGYRTALGAVSSPNPASERFHEAMGFVRQGCLENIGYKFGRPLSVVYYAKKLAPVMENPPRPRPITALANSEVDSLLATATGAAQPEASGARPK